MQKPKALFMTCADSRIDPELITGSGPGEIFVERNPGNFVPMYDNRARVGVTASIEYAVALLQVDHIVICGHSDCGAMKGLLKPELVAGASAVARWLSWGEGALLKVHRDYGHLSKEEQLQRLTELSILEQMEHLHSHPSVEKRWKEGTLGIHGWVYEIHTGRIDAYTPQTGRFEKWPE